MLAISILGVTAGAVLGSAQGPPMCDGPRGVASRETPPPVTTLRMRDAEVAIYAVDGELRYTVIERTGRISMHMGTQRDFVVHFPRLAAHVEAAFAEEGAPLESDGWIDASAGARAPARRDGTPDARP